MFCSLAEGPSFTYHEFDFQNLTPNRIEEYSLGTSRSLPATSSRSKANQKMTEES